MTLNDVLTWINTEATYEDMNKIASAWHDRNRDLNNSMATTIKVGDVVQLKNAGRDIVTVTKVNDKTFRLKHRIDGPVRHSSQRFNFSLIERIITDEAELAQLILMEKV